MLILVIKSFTTPTDPVAPLKFTIYNPHFLVFYTLVSGAAVARSYSYFVVTPDKGWLISPTTEKAFAAIDMLLCVIIWIVSATSPGELDHRELSDIDNGEDGILVLHDGRVVRNVSWVWMHNSIEAYTHTNVGSDLKP